MTRILIVDDQPYVGEFISEELAREGYWIASAGDAESIWGHLNRFLPDVVLLDLCLGEFKGWDILNDIKRKEPNLPVLILTAYDTFQEDPRVSKADGYVIKSFEAVDKLKQKITHVLKRKKGNRGATQIEMEERTKFPIPAPHSKEARCNL